MPQDTCFIWKKKQPFANADFSKIPEEGGLFFSSIGKWSLLFLSALSLVTVYLLKGNFLHPFPF